MILWVLRNVFSADSVERYIIFASGFFYLERLRLRECGSFWEFIKGKYRCGWVDTENWQVCTNTDMTYAVAHVLERVKRNKENR